MKFVLLGHPRSGSTLTTVALQYHPDIRMFGELFHAEFANRLIAYQWGISCRPSLYMTSERTKAWSYTEHQDGYRFLEELVFGDSSPNRPSATGFKFFYDHAQDGRARSAWNYLRQHEDVGIVHLTRTNLLDCLISTRTAEYTQVWELEADDPEPPSPPPFSISPQECEDYFVTIAAQRRESEKALFSNGRRVLPLTYEDHIEADFDLSLRRVQSFIGVDPISLPTLLRKQSRKPRDAQIENYDQLARHFAHTPFHGFFASTELA